MCSQHSASCIQFPTPTMPFSSIPYLPPCHHLPNLPFATCTHTHLPKRAEFLGSTWTLYHTPHSAILLLLLLLLLLFFTHTFPPSSQPAWLTLRWRWRQGTDWTRTDLWTVRTFPFLLPATCLTATCTSALASLHLAHSVNMSQIVGKAPQNLQNNTHMHI